MPKKKETSMKEGVIFFTINNSYSWNENSTVFYSSNLQNR